VSGSTAYRTGYAYGSLASGQDPSRVYGVSVNGVQRVAYAYDALGRPTARTVAAGPGHAPSYRYLDNPGGTTTFLVAGMTNGGSAELAYSYDAAGRVTGVAQGQSPLARYAYAALGQLTRVDDAAQQGTTIYAYDAGGNVTSATSHPYTLSPGPGPPLEVTCYTYGNPAWRDQLTGSSVHPYAGGQPGPATSSWLGYNMLDKVLEDYQSMKERMRGYGWAEGEAHPCRGVRAPDHVALRRGQARCRGHLRVRPHPIGV
jgi:YD repeat-containing protein